jgi:hypothetical protein
MNRGGCLIVYDTKRLLDSCCWRGGHWNCLVGAYAVLGAGHRDDITRGITLFGENGSGTNVVIHNS